VHSPKKKGKTPHPGQIDSTVVKVCARQAKSATNWDGGVVMCCEYDPLVGIEKVATETKTFTT